MSVKATSMGMGTKEFELVKNPNSKGVNLKERRGGERYRIKFEGRRGRGRWAWSRGGFQQSFVRDRSRRKKLAFFAKRKKAEGLPALNDVGEKKGKGGSWGL